ncbi:MAG: UDP-N-acetylglucosamine 2-epimerase (hydrolyzing) [Alphaproteobacteria bacterium]|nr:UDP-N-acetylglucosamine 2-epimerase (hydrolyzing) [Alphaproteobacteria bacterium]
MRLLSISSSRADVGILAPVWRAVAQDPDAALCVLLTGMHVGDDTAAREAIPDLAQVYSGGADLGGGERVESARAMGVITAFAADVYADWKPDLVLAVGDRLDMIPAVLAAVPFDVPIAHLHGGEQTFGAIDNDVRNALTKLAHVHCAASVEAAIRLNEMGEEAWRIHVTGGPGLDTMLAVPEMTEETFATETDLAAVAGLRLVTLHPETRAAAPTACLDAALEALAARPAPTLFTAPNSDPGGAEMRARIEAFVQEHSWCAFRETLGSVRYANALRHASMMIGNSSSGLIEAPLFGLPAINIGGRQEGRERATNVRDCPAVSAAVLQVMDRIDLEQRQVMGVSPYGDGQSGPRIAKVLRDVVNVPDITRKGVSSEIAAFRAPWEQEAPKTVAG